MTGLERLACGLGPDIQIVHAHTLARQLDESLLQGRLIVGLAAAFGILALALPAVGLYGVLAYSVARRTSEIGIRLTLGALPDQVARAAGITASIFLARLAEKLLFGVTPGDAMAQITAAATLAVTAFAASCLPARRAGRIDPAAALRDE